MTETQLKEFFSPDEFRAFERINKPINYGGERDWHIGQVQNFMLSYFKNNQPRYVELFNKALNSYPQLVGFGR